jgi:thiol-disulfide isomerase/thioredoxin
MRLLPLTAAVAPNLAVALALALAAPARAADEVAVGAPAPTFSLRAVNAEVSGAPWVSLEKLVGPEAEDAGAKVVLLSFFASWCEPCKREMPFLVRLDQEYREKGLRVISVDIDTEEAGQAEAKRLAAEAGFKHPVCSDRFNILARRYLGDKAPLPSAFLIRKDGTIAKVERGYAKDAPAVLLAAVRAELGLPAKGKATPKAK